jgi:hypothetical protein
MGARIASIYCMNAVVSKFHDRLFAGDVAGASPQASIISDSSHAN